MALSERKQNATCEQCGCDLTDSGQCPTCLLNLGTGLQSQNADPVRGTVFGDYELFEEIGRGGMGVVYRGWQRSLGREIVIKMIHGGVLAGRENIERFHYEARAASKLSHPNIVPVFDIGEFDGQHFFTMKFFEGGTLSDRMREFELAAEAAEFETDKSRITARQVVIAKLVGRIARAVHSAHTQGVIHRDLKPSNVLLDEDGTPFVGDFSLAKIFDEDGNLTVTGAILGTPSYMSPEQSTGRNEALGISTDVYGLGAILYHLIAGRPPFGSATPTETLRMVQEEEPTSLQRLVPQCHPDLATICHKCLRKEPPQRYSSALELAEELDRFRHFEPVLARPATEIERFLMWRRRKPVVAALTVAVLTIFIIGLGGVLFQWQEAEEARNEAITLATDLSETILNLDQRMVASLLATAKPEDALVYLADKLRRDPTDRRAASRAISLLESYEFSLPEFPNMVREDSIYRTDLSDDGSTFLTLSGNVEKIWSDDFSRYLQDRDRKREPGHENSRHVVQLWEFSSREPRGKPLVLDTYVYDADLSPDGDMIATAGNDHQATVWMAESADPLWQFDCQAPVLSLGFSPDGTRLVTTIKNRRADVWDLETGKHLVRSPQHEDYVYDAAFCSDGHLFATASIPCYIVDAQTGAPVHRLETDGAICYGIKFSPDGSRLVGMLSSHQARLWDVETGQAIGEPLLHAGVVWQADFSPDSLRIATAGGDGRARVWNATNASPISQWMHHEGPVNRVRFSPQGHLLATGAHDNAARVWDAFTGEPYSQRLMHGGYVWDLNFSPDGTRLVTGAHDGVSTVWDIRPGRALPQALDQNTDILLDVDHGGDWTVFRRPGNVGSIRLSLDRRLGIFKRSGIRIQAHKNEITTARINPRGTRLLLASRDGGVNLLDLSAYIDHLESIDPNQLTSVDPGNPVELRDFRTFRQGPHLRMDTQTMYCAAPLMAHPLPVLSARLSSDEERISTTTIDGTVRIWNLKDGSHQILEGISHTRPAWDAVWSSDDEHVASCSADGTVQVVSSRSGIASLAPLQHGENVRAVAFSSDNQVLISGTDGGVIRFWDLATGYLLGENRSATGPIRLIRPGKQRNTFAFQVDGCVTEFQSTVPWVNEDVPGALADLMLIVGNTALASKRLEDTDFSSIKQASRVTSASSPHLNEWMKWFLSDRTSRPIHWRSSSSKETAQDWGSIPNSGLESIREAIKRSPNDAQLFARHALSILRKPETKIDDSATWAAAQARHAAYLAPGDPLVAAIWNAARDTLAGWRRNRPRTDPPSDQQSRHMERQIEISDIRGFRLRDSREERPVPEDQEPLGPVTATSGEYLWVYDERDQPASFNSRNQLSGNLLGTTLSYDFYQGCSTRNETGQPDHADVAVTDGTHTLLTDLGKYNANVEWKQVRVDLNLLTDWRLAEGTFNGRSFRDVSTKPVPDPLLVVSVLENVEGVFFGIEQLHGGQRKEFIAIDNVILTRRVEQDSVTE